MADAVPANPNPNPNPNSLQAPPPSLRPPPSALLPPPSDLGAGHGCGRSFSLPRPAVRVTSEYDSDSYAFFHKVSCKLFDRIAKLKLSFQNDGKGELSFPQIGIITKNLSVFYDLESRNALLKGSLELAKFLKIRASHDVKTGRLKGPEISHISWSMKCLSMSCTCKDSKPIISCIYMGNVFQFKYQYPKEQQGEVAMIANLSDPSYKLELSSLVPSFGLPKATLRFPLGEVSLEEKENEEANKVLSVNGIVKGQFLNGICTALYKDNDLNIRYSYKDEEMSFIPSITLPSNALSFAFKRRFSPSDKLSYRYHFEPNTWSTVYKHTVHKDLKFKAGYDSEVRLGWASLWVGDEDGRAKTAPMKMKVQVMLQVPQDDIGNSAIMFRVKKRWDF